MRRFFVEKKKRAIANNKGADQPARIIANNKGADQPARMRRLICAFVVRTYIKAGFLSDSRAYIKHKLHYFCMDSSSMAYTHIETLGLLLCVDEYEIE